MNERVQTLRSSAASLLLLTAVAGCTGRGVLETELATAALDPAAALPPCGTEEPPPAPIPFTPGPSGLHRLTQFEYARTVEQLLGAPLVVPEDIEPDFVHHQFARLGAGVAPFSAVGIERFEAAAQRLAAQVFADATRRVQLVGCTPASGTDPCLRPFLQRFARQAWRRPLTTAELDTYVQRTASMATLLGSPWRGLENAVSTLLQSPHFLYRVELGEPDPARPGARRYTSHEIASRMAALLWSAAPDVELLDAADAGELLTPEGIRAQATRMLEAPLARSAVLHFFSEHLGLTQLAAAAKDTTLFPRYTPSLASAMREEVDRVLEDLVFTRRTDVFDLLTTRETFVNGELAGVYGLPAPAASDYSGTGVELQLPVANGEYDVFLWQIETYQSNYRRFDVRLEGQLVATAIGDQPLAAWKKHGPFPARVADGALTVHLVANGKGEPSLHALALYRRGSTTFVRGVNLGGPEVVVAGNTFSSMADAKAAGLRVSTTNEFVSQGYAAPFTPEPDAATRPLLVSGIWGSNPVSGSGAGWAKAQWPLTGERTGLLGLAGVLSMQAVSTRGSAVRRGHFVLGRLLCREVPPPPDNVDTTTLNAGSGTMTMREKLQRHRADPACAGCHDLMDPLGLPLEHFDAIGAYRPTDNGLTIDVSGSLDGKGFTGPAQMASVLRENTATQECLPRQVYRYATGRLEGAGESALMADLARRSATTGNRFDELLIHVLTSDGFRFASSPQ